jgi:hypothetical protein
MQVDVLETEARSCQRATLDIQVRAELFDDISYDPIIGGRGCSENRDGPRKRPQYPNDSPVIWSEIVSPVRNAVSLVYNEETNPIGNGQEASGDKIVIGESLR